jgi:hypothetical protein
MTITPNSAAKRRAVRTMLAPTVNHHTMKNGLRAEKISPIRNG